MPVQQLLQTNIPGVSTLRRSFCRNAAPPPAEPFASAIPDTVVHKGRLMRQTTYIDLKPHLDLLDKCSTESDRRRRRRCEEVKNHVLIAMIVLVIVVTTVTLAIVLSPTHDLPNNSPNIIIIVADDLGYNDVGYFNEKYNMGQIRTPYIDKLASESVQLRRHYAQAMCSPSRAALLTGRYPFRYGMGGSRAIYSGSKNGLNLDETLLPQILQNNEYDTYLVGKWHLGFADWAMTPLRRGFDYFLGTYGGSTTYYTHDSYYAGTEARDFFEDSINIENRSKIEHKVLDDNTTFSELIFTDKAVEIISTASQNQGVKRRPFFLMMSYMNPHAPITPMEKDLQQNLHIENENRRKMAAMITSLDYGVGRITSTLETTNQLNQTIIVFLSDNGGHVMMMNGESLGSSNLPLRGAKCTLYEGGVRTPAFIRIPHTSVNSTLVYDGLFHVVDWLPTLASLARIPLHKSTFPLDGIDHSEVFQELYKTGVQRIPSPRSQVVLDIDPVYNLAGIIEGNFKLMIGNPAPLNFSIVFPLLPANVSSYEANASENRGIMERNKEKQDAYESSSSPCLSISCMSENVTLYDLSIDVSEEIDISWRFSDVKTDLWNALSLYANSSNPLTRPQFFEDQQILNATIMHKGALVWQPWLGQPEIRSRD